MGNQYPPNYGPPGQQSGYDPYQQQPQTYQSYNQPGPSGPYNPYPQQPDTYQQSGQQMPGGYPGSGAYPPPGGQPNIFVNVQQPQNLAQPLVMVPVSPPNNGKAIAALVLGIVAWVGASILTGIPAVILGHMALGEINRSNGTQSGRGLAITGLVLGYLSLTGIVCVILYVIFVLGIFASAAAGGGGG